MRHEHIKGNIKGKHRNQGQHKQQKHPGHGTFEPMTPQQAGQFAGKQAGLKWNPVIHQEQRQLRASGQRQQDIGSWYGQLNQQIQNTAGQTDASYAAANAAMNANLEAAARASQAEQGQINAQNAEFAKLTGADPTNFQQGMQQRAAGAEQRALTQTMLAAPIAQAGAAQAGYLRNVGINAKHEGIYQRGQEHKRALQIKEDLLNSRKERGAETATNLGNLRQQEIENQTKREAFNLERKTGNREAKRDAAKERREAKEAREANRRANEAQRNENQEQHNQNEAAHNEGKSGGMTPSEKRDAKEGRQNAMSTARALIQANGWPKTAKEWAGFQVLLAKESEISPREAAFAVKRLKKRHQQKQASKSPNVPPTF